jgi:hypothetical protein
MRLTELLNRYTEVIDELISDYGDIDVEVGNGVLMKVTVIPSVDGNKKIIINER